MPVISVLDVTPVLPANDHTDGAFVHAVLQANQAVGRATTRVFGAYLSDLRLGEDRHAVGFSPQYRFRWLSAPFSDSALRHHVSKVIGVGSWKEMRAPDAGRIIAVVTDVKIVRDGADLDDVGNTVSQEATPPAACVDPAIPVAVTVAGPHPARPEFGAVWGNRTVLVDLLPEAIHERASEASTRSGGTTSIAAKLPQSTLKARGIGADGSGAGFTRHDSVAIWILEPRHMAAATSRTEAPSATREVPGRYEEHCPARLAGALNSVVRAKVELHSEPPFRVPWPRLFAAARGSFVTPILPL